MFAPMRHLSLLNLIIALAACGTTPAAQPPAAPTTPPSAVPATAAPTTARPTAALARAPAAAPAAAITITDALGRQVTLDGPPARIVSLAPSVTEILFAIGAGPQVVGVTKFCTFPPEADALPEIGGFSTKSISLEAIVGLEPDLVVAGTASQQPVVEQLEQLAVPVVVLAPKSFEEVYANIAQAGYLTGHVEQATAVVDAMRTRVDAVTARVATIPAEERPTVYWEVYDEPLTTAGPETFIGQLIDLAGATNSFADASEDYPQVSAEAVFARDPQVILGPNSQSMKLTLDAVGQRPGWADVRAVRDERIYLLDGDIVSRPGPRLADALEALAAALYPGAFQ
jgi:iron complex transport system substrate-binding protein